MSADILRICDEVLAASNGITPLPWTVGPNLSTSISILSKRKLVDPGHAFGTGDEKEAVCTFRFPLRKSNAHYVAIAANTAPALAEYIRRLHSAAAVRGINIDTWDLPRQPR